MPNNKGSIFLFFILQTNVIEAEVKYYIHYAKTTSNFDNYIHY